MKKIILVVLLVFAAQVASYADESPQVSDFENKNKDSKAIFLLKSINIQVNEDWSYVTHVHKIIKIFKEEAKDLGEIPIEYQSSVDKFGKVKAFTLTPDGKKHHYTKIQDIKINDSQMYSDSMVKIITLPEVNIGSILDHEYTITSKDLQNCG